MSFSRTLSLLLVLTAGIYKLPRHQTPSFGSSGTWITFGFPSECCCSLRWFQHSCGWLFPKLCSLTASPKISTSATHLPWLNLGVAISQKSTISEILKSGISFPDTTSLTEHTNSLILSPDYFTLCWPRLSLWPNCSQAPPGFKPGL